MNVAESPVQCGQGRTVNCGQGGDQLIKSNNGTLVSVLEVCGGWAGEKEVVVAELKPHLAGRGTIIFRSHCCAPRAPRAQSAVRGRAAAGERTFVDKYWGQ